MFQRILPTGIYGMGHALHHFSTRELAAATVGCIGVALIGFDASPFGPSPLYIGASLLLAGLPLIPWKEFRERKNDPIVWIMLFLAFGVLIRSTADLIYPTMNPEHFDPESWWSFFRISGIFSLLIGFWVSCFPRAGLLGIGAMIIGMSSNVIFHKFWNELALAFSSGYRFEGEAAVNSMGFFTAPMPAIGILLAIIGGSWLYARKQRLLESLLILICTYYSVTNLLILIATKSRHNWIAGLVTLVIAIVIIIRYLYLKSNQKHILWKVLPFVILITIILGFSWGTITKRWELDIKTINAIATLNAENIGSPIESRYEIWQFGVNNLSKYPLLGWGPGYVKGTFNLAKSNNLKRFSGYHNLYIQLAVCMGTIWMLLWVIFHMIILLRNNNKNNNEVYLTSITGSLIVITTFVSGLAEFRFFQVNGMDLYIFGTGLLIGSKLQKKKNESILNRKNIK